MVPVGGRGRVDKSEPGDAPKKSDLIRGKFGPHKKGSEWCVIAWLSEEDDEAILRGLKGWNNRVREPLRFDKKGARALSFDEAVALMSEEDWHICFEVGSQLSLAARLRVGARCQLRRRAHEVGSEAEGGSRRHPLHAP